MEDFLGLGGEDVLPFVPSRVFLTKLALGTGERNEKTLGSW